MNRDNHTDDLAGRIRELEEQLCRTRRAACSARDTRIEFLGNVHHELRTPLNAVLGMLDLLLDSPLSEEQRTHLATASEYASALLRLINDMVDLSRLHAGDLPLEPAPFDLRELMEEVGAGLTSKAQAKGLDVVVHISGEISTHFHADRARIGQMLHHLIDNAVKFTDRGQVVVTARSLAAGEDREKIRVSVSDTGIGIPAERQREIFEVFTQENSSSTRNHGGLGFGLALVQSLTERMQGSLGMESVPGRGSNFWIDLWLERVPPLQEDTDSARDSGVPCSAGETDAEGSKPFRGTRVLLVDDNHVNLRVAQRLLERHGCDTRIATNGREAVDAATEADFDLILMDVQMPVMDGLDATREIRAREAATGRRTPIVALTANVLAEDRARCFEAGMEEFLSKPVGSKVLAATLSRFGRSAAAQGRG